jgi:hypothetical protein
MNPICNGHAGAVQEHSHRLQSTGSPPHFGSTGHRLPDGVPKVRQMMEITMFHKLSLAALAAVALGGAALAPTPAAAWYGGYHHGWWGPRFYVGAPVSYGYGGCYVRQLVPTPWGPRWRLVNRCY